MPPLSTIFISKLKKGMSGPDVVRLQKLLSLDKTIYPEGVTTGFFGEKTYLAVLRFQLKYGVITSPTDMGAGMLGPKTRAKIEEVCSAWLTASVHVDLIVTSPTSSKWVAPIRADKFVLTQAFLVPDSVNYPKTGHHPGVDYGTGGEDTVPLYFCADGEIIESGLHPQFGNYFFYYVPSVDHTFLYFHARDTAPAKGIYKAGDPCGIAGETGLAHGIHLHLECMKGKKTSADRRALYTSFDALKLAAEDGDAFIRSRIT